MSPAFPTRRFAGLKGCGGATKYGGTPQTSPSSARRSTSLPGAESSVSTTVQFSPFTSQVSVDRLNDDSSSAERMSALRLIVNPAGLPTVNGLLTSEKSNEMLSPVSSARGLEIVASVVASPSIDRSVSMTAPPRHTTDTRTHDM